jgi:phosphatidylserine decarboxylase
MNAFKELLQRKKININDTFYIIDTFYDTKWVNHTKGILLNIGAKKIIYSKKELPEKESSEQINAIFPLGLTPPKQNQYYNCIFFDSVTTFYNCPLISYFHVNIFTKLSFIPNRNDYIINDLETVYSLYDTFYYFIKQFTLLYISSYFIYMFAFFYKDPLFQGSFKDYNSLNAYFTRDITHITQITPINKYTTAISPCCGIVMDSGDISGNKHLFQTIKNEKIQLYTNQFTKYINIFLRPNDYHCFHAPISGKIVNIEYYQGTRYMLSTNNKVVINSSLIKNTKIAIHIKNEEEEILMIAIGGFFIGSIQLLIQQNSIVKIGDKLGYFDFGSSILFLHNNSNYHLNNGFVKVFDLL